MLIFMIVLLLNYFNSGNKRNRWASTPCEHELVSVKAQCLHSDELEEEGECKPGGKGERGERDCACSIERKGELRQKHVRDVARLPQAEERGGVVEHWRSAERSAGERKRDKAGGEEARSKDRTVWIRERRQRGKKPLLLHDNKAAVKRK